MRISDLSIDPEKFPKGFKARVINKDPYIVKINNLIEDDVIAALLSMAKNKFERSSVIVDGQLIYNDKQRNSSTAYIFTDGLPDKYPEPIERLIKRLRYLTGSKRNEMEVMAVRYKKGEFFGKHVDYLDKEEVGQLDKAGNRITTFFIYLNTLEKEDGGETEFTKLGLKSRPKKGDALFWYNRDPKTLKYLPLTEHQGRPVLTDTIKVAINVWQRSEPFL